MSVNGYQKIYYYIVTKDKGFWVFVKETNKDTIIRLQKITELQDEGVAIKTVRKLNDGIITEDVFKEIT